MKAAARCFYFFLVKFSSVALYAPLVVDMPGSPFFDRKRGKNSIKLKIATESKAHALCRTANH